MEKDIEEIARRAWGTSGFTSQWGLLNPITRDNLLKFAQDFAHLLNQQASEGES